MSTNSQNLFYPRRQRAQAGFTLVEIMVGIVIGMLATLVIMQVLSVFENQKRTTTGASDALTNGNIALFKLGRDLQQASYALVPLSNTPLMCNEPIPMDAAITAAGVTDISPVTITDGGNGANNTDRIIIRYGSAPRGGIPSSIQATPVGNVVTVQSTVGCEIGNVALVMSNALPPAAPACGLTFITGIQPSTSALTGTPGGHPTGTLTLGAATNAMNSGSVSCLGDWTEVTYALQAGTSTSFDLTQNLVTTAAPLVGAAAPGGPTPIVADIVSIQAQYGISPLQSINDVTQWVDATGIWAPGSITVANRNRIKAVRIAIVARDAKKENIDVTTPCTVANNGPCTWADVPGSPAPLVNLADPDWKKYRYRVYESIYPLRNVIWTVFP